MLCPINYDENYYLKLDIYSEIVKKITKVIEELKLDNIHEQFYAFCYLLWNGYFSINKSYIYSDIVLDELCNIFLGSGNSRSNASLLSNVLNQSNLLSKPIFLNLQKIKLKELLDTDIAKKQFNGITIKSGLYNHDVCLGPCNDNIKHIFILDPTLLTECEIIKNSKLVCFNGKYKINHKLFKEMLDRNYKFNCKYNSHTILTTKLLKQYYETAQLSCFKNQTLLDSFYEDNFSNYEHAKSLCKNKI